MANDAQNLEVMFQINEHPASNDGSLQSSRKNALKNQSFGPNSGKLKLTDGAIHVVDAQLNPAETANNNNSILGEAQPL